MAPTPTALQSAEKLYESGHWQRARVMCTDLLASDPNDDRTLRLLALIAYQNGRAGDAIELLRRAISVRENVTEYHVMLGNSYRKLKQLGEATAAYRRAIELAPDAAQTHNNLGTCLFDQGKVEEAIESYQRAMALSPDLAAVHYNLGNAYQLRKCHDQAVASYARALQLNPNSAATHTNIGAALYAGKRFDDAIDHYRKAIELEPNRAEAHNNLGVVFHDQSRLDSAIACYRRALAIREDYVDARINLGSALKVSGQFDEAIEIYRRVLAAMPECAEAHNNLGVVLQAAGSFEQALGSYKHAIELRESYAEAHSNYGSLLREMGQLDKAVEKFRAVIEMQPELIEAHVGLADALSDMNESDAALREFDCAIEISSDNAEARFARSLALLRAGEFERGWEEFEWRWQTPQLKHRELPTARWNGEPLEGRTILIHAEQGLGDTLQFVRYLRLVGQAGGRVVLACQQDLHRLLQGVAGIDELAALGEPLPEFDCHVSLLGLPRIFRTRLDNIPAEVPYLLTEQSLVDSWREKLGEIKTKRIGICWQGNPDYRRDRFRSFPLENALRLADGVDAIFVSLQRSAEAEDDRLVQFNRVDSETGAFVDTAAIISNLDLVISCDTAVAHLAGAIGAPVWVALERAADWRWLSHRDDSPWYPTMKVFRQTRLGEWDDVFARMASELRLGKA